MKPLNEWDEKYLLEFVNGEYTNFEIKRSEFVDISKITDGTERSKKRITFADYFARLISAFANFDGGYLILGMTDPRPNKSMEIDGGVALNINEDTKQWLEHMIPTLIDPPVKFDIYPIVARYEDSKILPDHAVYVVYIFPSEHAPHQHTTDRKFYGRGGSTLYPLTIRQIKDIIGRQIYPKCDLKFSFVTETVRVQDNIVSETNYLEIEVFNSGRVYANYVNADIEIPRLILWTTKEQKYQLQDYDSYQIQRKPFPTETFTFDNFEDTRYTPILPGRSHRWKVTVKSDLRGKEVEGMKIQWKIFADNAPQIEGEIYLETIKWRYTTRQIPS